ncbi:MAG: tripartite tricarboxylate transporter substrate binding protein [Acetobacteraceae bacterium]|nr:tripartite tricarboxylate transporter substrate binding protein [Acetobacteraceae bacterium]
MIGRRMALAGAATVLVGGRARAQAGFPSRPIRLVIPFAAGGSADAIARLLTDSLAESLGQPVVPENRPGAGATIGAEQVARAAPDGHTLVVVSTGHTTNETLQPTRGYVLMRDLAPVALINRTVYLLVARPSLPARSVAELVAYAKANPGRLDYASSGPGSPYHFAGALFCHRAGIEAQHVPFARSSDARNALVGGQVHFMFGSINTQAPLIEAGRVRLLATTGAARTPLMPEAPTLAETYPGLEMGGFVGVMAPAATPRPVAERLHAAFNRALALPAVGEGLRRMGSEPAPISIAAFDTLLREDIEKRREYVRLVGMLPE